MLTIGEFSTATQLTLKALRLYHEDGILVPEQIDAQTGYRYYGDASFEKAQAVKLLRELGFSLKEMKEIFSSYREDEDLEVFFLRKLKEVDQELARYQAVKQRIRYFLANEKESDMKENFIITEKSISDTTMCGIRFQGSYPDIGKYYGELFIKAGRFFTGAPFALYYDGEYKDAAADIEAAIEVKKAVSIDGISCRVLSGGKVVSIVYKGAYENIGDAYKRLFEYLKLKGYTAKVPSREIYLKGPGMIFPRNPKKFITEIMISV